MGLGWEGPAFLAALLWQLLREAAARKGRGGAQCLSGECDREGGLGVLPKSTVRLAA